MKYKVSGTVDMPLNPCSNNLCSNCGKPLLSPQPEITSEQMANHISKADVDENMRMAARMLYDIILDNAKEPPEKYLPDDQAARSGGENSTQGQGKRRSRRRSH